MARHRWAYYHGNSSDDLSIKFKTVTSYIVPLMIPIYLLILLGNILVIITVIKTKKLRTREHVFIVCLALTAVILLVMVVPYNLGMFWCQCLPYPHDLCVMVGMASLIAIMWNLFNMASIALFRYFRVVLSTHPVLSGLVSVVIMEFLSVCFAIVLPFVATLVGWTSYGYVEYLNRCTLTPMDNSNLYLIAIMVMVSLCFVILVFAYCSIGCVLLKSKSKMRRVSTRRNQVAPTVAPPVTVSTNDVMSASTTIATVTADKPITPIHTVESNNPNGTHDHLQVPILHISPDHSTMGSTMSIMSPSHPQDKHPHPHHPHHHQSYSREVKLAKICAAKFLVFLIGYGPYLIVSTMYSYAYFSPEFQELAIMAYWVGISGSPLVYGFLFNDIRLEILKLKYIFYCKR